MGRELKKRVLLFEVLILSLLFVVGMTIVEAAVRPIVKQLPPGMVIGDDKGIDVKEDGKYLIEVNDVAPGKRWKTEITMLNIEKDVPYALSMKIYPPEVSGPIDFSKAIGMKLTYGKEVLYDGPLSGVSDKVNLQKTYLDLGTLSSGDSKGLTVELEMDSSYTENDFMVKSVTENIWEFRAVKTEKPIEPGKKPPIKKPGIIGLLPQTGEEWRNTLIGICLGLFLLMSILLILKKRREERR